MNEVTYTLLKKDFTDFSRFSLKIPRIIDFYFKRALTASIIVTIIFIITHLKIMSIKSICILFLFFLITIFIGVLAIAFLGGGLKNYQLTKGLDLTETLTLTEEGLKRTSKSNSTIFYWNNVKGIYNTKNLFLVFISDFQSVLIPKRAFENEEESGKFYDSMLKYWQNKPFES